MDAPQTNPKKQIEATFGSLATAMMLGAFIAVSLLYYWGSQIAQEEQIASPPGQEQL